MLFSLYCTVKTSISVTLITILVPKVLRLQKIPDSYISNGKHYLYHNLLMMYIICVYFPFWGYDILEKLLDLCILFILLQDTPKSVSDSCSLYVPFCTLKSIFLINTYHFNILKTSQSPLLMCHYFTLVTSLSYQARVVKKVRKSWQYLICCTLAIFHPFHFISFASQHVLLYLFSSI